jgi:myo-inositol catabolism protein IolC
MVATNGAYDNLQIDPCNTWLEVQCGVKLLIVAVPKDGDHEVGSVKIFLDKKFSQSGLNPEWWRLEAIALTPGTRV